MAVSAFLSVLSHPRRNPILRPPIILRRRRMTTRGNTHPTMSPHTRLLDRFTPQRGTSHPECSQSIARRRFDPGSPRREPCRSHPPIPPQPSRLGRPRPRINDRSSTRYADHRPRNWQPCFLPDRRQSRHTDDQVGRPGQPLEPTATDPTDRLGWLSSETRFCHRPAWQRGSHLYGGIRCDRIGTAVAS